MPRNNNTQQFRVLEQKYKSFRRQLPRKVGITAVNFFKRNFRQQGFVDKPFRRWKGKSNPRDKRKILVKSGRLRRDIKVLRISSRRVVVGIGSNNKYARIHNDGGKLPITPKMRRYFWAIWYKTGNEYYKNLALTKKTYLEIPARPFIDDSKALEVTVERMIIKELNKAVR